MNKLSGSWASVLVLAALSCSKASGVGAAGGGSKATGGGTTAGSTTSSGDTTASATSGTGGSETSASSGATAGTGASTGTGTTTTTTTTPSACSGAVHSTAAPIAAGPAVALTVPSGFTLTTIAKVPSARQLVALPNGDLLVATNGQSVWLVPNADAAAEPGAPVVFATAAETPTQGLAFDASTCTLYASSQHSIYSMPYVDGQQSATPGTAIASVRTGSISPNRPPGDTDNHTSTSVGFAAGVLYAGVGSSCNACVETDETRASIQRFDPGGANMETRATRFRNAIALTTNPATGTLWAGGAGQDNLTEDHPYEFFDAVTLHAGVADYGWPECEENHVAYTAGSDCTDTVAPLIELPSYSTIIGASFYPAAQAGAHVFPAAYQGGLFLTTHGSWHKDGSGKFVSMPQVVYVAMNGDAPVKAVDWSDPTAQWKQFAGGFQLTNGTTRIARPTGIAVGAQGSLLIADDQNGYVYRVRPM